MIKFRLLLLLLPLLMGACSPVVSTMLMAPYPALDYKEDVRIIYLNEPVPKQAAIVGSIRISDSGFTTNCSWDMVLERARTEARKVGGNAIKIEQHSKPGLASTCHQIKASILKILPESEVLTETETLAESGVLTETETLAETETYYKPVMRQPVVQQDDMSYLPEPPKMRLGINGGWSSHIARVSDDVPADLKQYVTELKRGYHFGADASYFVSDHIGIGLKLNSFNTSNSLDVYTTPPNGPSQSGKMTDHISINFIGPMLTMLNLDMSNTNAFYSGFGIGYMSYSHQSKVIRDSFSIKGGTVGLSFDLGYDFGLNKNTALGVQLSLLAGTLTQFELTHNGMTTTNKLPEDSYESLARIDLTVGLRFLK